MVWAVPAERPSRASLDEVPEVAGTASLPAEAGGRAAAFEDVVSDESAEKPSVAAPAMSEVEAGAKDIAGAAEPSPDESAGLTVWLEPATTGDALPNEVAGALPKGAVPGVPPAEGGEAWPPGLSAAAA